jgi:hypothetical protein
MIMASLFLTERFCDICGRSEEELIAQLANRKAELALDADGLWVCGECRGRLITRPVGELDEVELDEEIQALVGESAGAICHTLNLPNEPPYQDIVDAACKIAYDEDRHMSAWSFVSQWQDGSTVWQSADGSARAIVRSDGTVEVLAR